MSVVTVSVVTVSVGPILLENWHMFCIVLLKRAFFLTLCVF